MNTYAQLNEDGICVSITQTPGVLEGPQFVVLPFFDLSVLLKKWTGTEWVTPDPAP